MRARFADYVTYRSEDGVSIRSYLIVPPGANKSPGVLIFRGVAGPDDGYIEIANTFSKAGFATLMHGWQIRGDDPPDKEVSADALAALKYLSAHDDIAGANIAVVGYCRGGAHGVLVASQHTAVRALVLVHGMSRRHALDEGHPCHPVDLANKVTCPVLILHGEADDISPIEGMRELGKAFGSRQQAWFTAYPSARHGFAVRTHPGFAPSPAKDAHKKTIEFLYRHVPVETA